MIQDHGPRRRIAPCLRSGAALLCIWVTTSVAAADDIMSSRISDRTEYLLQLIDHSRDLDISNSLTDLVASIDDVPSIENMERLHTLADYYYYMDKYTELGETAEKLERISGILADGSHAGVATDYGSYSSGMQGDYMHRVDELEAQIISSRMSSDYMVTIVASNLWGSMMPFLGEHNIAIAKMVEAGEFIDQSTERDRLRHHLNFSLGYVYREQGDLGKTSDHYLKSLEVAKSAGLKTDLGNMLYNTAEALRTNNSHQMSIRFYESLTDWYKKIHQENNLLFSYYGLARNYFQIEDYQAAWEYIQLADQRSTASEDIETSLHQMGAEVAARLGKIDEARRYRDQVKAYFLQHPSYTGSTWELTSIRIDAEIARSEGKLGEAYELLDDFSAASLERVANETRRDIEKSRKQLAEISQLEKAEQNLIIRNGKLKLLVFQILVFVAVMFLALLLLALHKQKKAAIALKNSRRAAEAANRSKSLFLAMMSHEIRTPLNGVLGMSEVLLESGLQDKHAMMAEVIRSSGQDLLLILNDILDLAKLEAGNMDVNMEAVDYEEIISSVERLMSPLAEEKGIRLCVKIPDGTPETVNGDAGKVQQVLNNLVGNAIKFTTEGHVTISVAAEAKPPGRADQLRLSVTDTGMGIAQDAQERLFERFAQADNSISRKFGGTGLGLAICKELMDLMGGTIGCDSDPGTGSTFWFTLPVISDRSSVGTASSR